MGDFATKVTKILNFWVNAKRNSLQLSEFQIVIANYWRRERDSNPRYVSVRRFSRPLQSTTLPSLLVLHMMDNLHCECGGFPKASAKLKEIFVLAKFSFDFFVVACYFVCFSALYESMSPLPLLIGLLQSLATSFRTKKEQIVDYHSE